MVGGYGGGHPLVARQQLRFGKLLRPIQVGADADAVVANVNGAQVAQVDDVSDLRALGMAQICVMPGGAVQQLQYADRIVLQQYINDMELPFRQDPAARAAELAEQRPRQFAKQNALVIGDDFPGDQVALLRYPRQSKAQERRKVMPLPPGFVQGCEVVLPVGVVVVGKTHQNGVIDASLFQQESLHGAGRPSVAVAKGMNGRKVIVDGQRADNRVVRAQFGGGGAAERIQSGGAIIAAFGATAARLSENNIAAGLTIRAGFAVVVIAVGNHQTMDL